MPSLPQYNSRQNIEAKTPLPLRNEAEAKNKAGAIMASAVEGVGDKWVAAQTNMQTTAVKAGYAEKKAAIEATADADTDINGADKRFKELEKAKQEVLKGVSSPALKNQLAFQLDHENNLASIKINGTYRQKQIFADRLNTESVIRGASKERADAIRAGNAVRVAAKDAEILKMLEGKAATQMLTPTQAKELYETYQEGAVDFDIQADASTTQDSPVLKELLKGEKGIYGNLPADKLAKKIKDAKINIWRNKNAVKKAADESNAQGALDMSKALVTNNLTISSIESLARSGIVDAKTAAIFENAIDQKQRTFTTEDSSKTADYLIKLIDKDKSTALDVLTKAATLRSTNDIDDASYGFVIQEAAKKLEREKAGLEGWDPSTINFMNAAKGAMDFAQSISPAKYLPMASDMIRKMIEKIQNGKEPKVAVKEVQREKVLELHPQALTYPETGKKTIDSSGALKTITPEGDLLDAEEEENAV